MGMQQEELNQALNEAIEAGDVARVRLLLGSGASPVMPVDPNEEPPLFWAVFGNQAEITRRLLEAGARVGDYLPESESTALHVAAENGNLSITHILMEFDGVKALDRFDYVSRTPLICAIEGNHLELATYLISAGAEVNARDTERIGNTALHCAVEEGNLEAVQLLLNAGADPFIPGWMMLCAYEEAEAPDIRTAIESHVGFCICLCDPLRPAFDRLWTSDIGDEGCELVSQLGCRNCGRLWVLFESPQGSFQVMPQRGQWCLAPMEMPQPECRMNPEDIVRSITGGRWYFHSGGGRGFLRGAGWHTGAGE